MNTMPSLQIRSVSALDPAEPIHRYEREHGQLLLMEMSHRVNNEFASAISMVSLNASRSSDAKVKSALEDVLEKLHHYAHVHRALEIPTTPWRIDTSSYLSDLCRSISNAKLACRNIELVFVERPPIQLTAENCWTLGMVISELITNVVRHAFGEHGGTIRVELRTHRGQTECRVSDNGVGMEVCNPGSGIKIISSLVDVLGGTFEQYSGPDGTLSVIAFPVSN
ncbi:sensor histidine kinase [Bradyrhizobium sp.]|uniref:sensor histidine kinase n=1 Tax=Bradyrhizobium sp. TaxID=376 RepID=UPI003C252783